VTADALPASDTIAAIATATGPAGVGIVRISGPDAFAIADRVFPRNAPVYRQTTHTLRRATLHDPTTGEPIDDGLLAVFHDKRSFTGEPVVEFQGHGGTVNLTRVFAACITAGARPARPGEFSERAFSNGKLDLAQAEAIADLVAAGTVAAQRAAQRQAAGELSANIRSCQSHIEEALARIEASIDFPEEVGEIDERAVGTALSRAAGIIAGLLSGAGYGRRLRDGLTLVLTGRPNVGKSSLLNALAGTERAIVTPIPGTTRDVVEEQLNIAGMPVRALDTAGLRDTEDPVERIGVERARRAVDEADVIIAVLDATAGVTEEDTRLLASLSDRVPSGCAVIAINKTDRANADAMRMVLSAHTSLPIVPISATTSAGLIELTATIAEAVAGTVPAEPPLVTSARHEAALRVAADSLSRAINTLSAGLPPELIAVDAHGAIQSLGEITGQTTREDIIAGIFARFCIGK
jgi:tRNA modification GTPase